MNFPEISVIMPVYNAEKYIRKTIESILKQTEENFELIIVDDCGTDSSMDIVKSITDNRIRIITNECNKGIAYSRNIAIDHARGKYLALMDDDDIAPIHRFETEKKFLDNHPEVDVVGGQLVHIDEDDEEITYPNHVSCNPKVVWAEFLFGNRISNGTAMIRAEFVKENHIRYRDGFLGMEDYKFWTECSAKGVIVNLNEVLLYWRTSANNETQRVFREKERERKALFAKIQIEALQMKGFILTEAEQEIFCKCFCENTKVYISLADLKLAHQVLTKLIRQARELHSDKAKEFEFVCHRWFGMRTENSEIWQNELND